MKLLIITFITLLFLMGCLGNPIQTENTSVDSSYVSSSSEIYEISNGDSSSDETAPYILNPDDQVYALLDTVEILFSEDIIDFSEDNYTTDSVLTCDFKEGSYNIIQCIPSTLNDIGQPILPENSEFAISFSYITDFSNNILYTETYRFISITEEWYEEYGYY